MGLQDLGSEEVASRWTQGGAAAACAGNQALGGGGGAQPARALRQARCPPPARGSHRYDAGQRHRRPKRSLHVCLRAG
jgi:hypothetical protein